MVRCLQRIGGNEIIVFKEIAAHFRREKYNAGEYDQEYHHPENILHRVVGMERYAIYRNMRYRILVRLDLDPVRVIRADFVQGQYMHYHQHHKQNRQRHDVVGKKAVERSIRQHEVAQEPVRERFAHYAELHRSCL